MVAEEGGLTERKPWKVHLFRTQEALFRKTVLGEIITFLFQESYISADGLLQSMLTKLQDSGVCGSHAVRQRYLSLQQYGMAVE